ncbi:MAG: uroporphyrinogen decarboxylase family protein [Victivallales bacterium]|jgi:uroporphyrinogen decarboxylase
MGNEIGTRENFLSTARRQPSQWIPLDFGMSRGALRKFHEEAGAEITPSEYFKFDGAWLGPSGTRLSTPDWKALYYTDGSLPDGSQIDPEWGTAHLCNQDSDDQMDFFPLRNISCAKEVDEFPWPDAAVDYRFEGLAENVAAKKAEDHAIFVGSLTFFESVWNLRGFESLMVDMAESSPVAHRLFERMYEINVAKAELIAKTGCDIMQCGSDVATQRGPLMSQAMWREYIMPVMRDSIQAAKKVNPDLLVIYHSCGNVSSMIDGFIEAGIDILDPCQPEAMDIFELKRRYGKVLTFHGGIGVQSVLPHGTPDQVRDMVRKTIDIMADGGGYLCSSSHSLGQDIPWRNIIAFVKTVREYGHP